MPEVDLCVIYYFTSGGEGEVKFDEDMLLLLLLLIEVEFVIVLGLVELSSCGFELYLLLEYAVLLNSFNS